MQQHILRVTMTVTGDNELQRTKRHCCQYSCLIQYSLSDVVELTFTRALYITRVTLLHSNMPRNAKVCTICDEGVLGDEIHF